MSDTDSSVRFNRCSCEVRPTTDIRVRANIRLFINRFIHLVMNHSWTIIIRRQMTKGTPNETRAEQCDSHTGM